MPIAKPKPAPLRYWLVKWATNTRISEKCRTAKEACKYCYGIVADNMQVSPFTKKWNTLSAVARLAIEHDLKPVGQS